MEFIQDNYVWFVVGGIILIMALIGYIAEKTDFGKQKFSEKVKPEKEVKTKPVKEKKSKKNKKKIEDPILENNEPIIEDFAQPITNEEVVPLEEQSDNLSFDQIGTENLEVPFGDQAIDSVDNDSENENIDVPEESIDIPEVVISDDLNAPFGDETLEISDGNLDEPIEESKVPLEFNFEELNEDNQDADETKDVDLDIPEVINNEETKEMSLPELDTLNNETVDEEDVWKF